MSFKKISHTLVGDLSRRRFLGLAGIGLVAGTLAQVRRAEAKTAKAAARYQDNPNGDKSCANCRLFLADSGTCRVVDGDISADAYCRFWAG